MWCFIAIWRFFFLPHDGEKILHDLLRTTNSKGLSETSTMNQHLPSCNRPPSIIVCKLSFAAVYPRGETWEERRELINLPLFGGCQFGAKQRNFFELQCDSLMFLCPPGLIHLSQGHAGRYLCPPQQEGEYLHLHSFYSLHDHTLRVLKFDLTSILCAHTFRSPCFLCMTPVSTAFPVK